MYDAELYRKKAEVEEWKKKDPLVLLQKRLETMGLWEETNAQGLEDEIAQIVDEAVDFAEKSDLEPIEDLMRFVYSPKEKQ
jgi:TPP-dependent pyruvate/acetoin dehydrogenase alpha subunit